jgi:hypothetical protein
MVAQRVGIQSREFFDARPDLAGDKKLGQFSSYSFPRLKAGGKSIQRIFCGKKSTLLID